MTAYRTDDLTRWGSGIGRNLTPTEVDLNFWDAIQRLVYLEAQPGASPIITHFSVDGTSFFVHFDNAVIMGPYELPVALFRIREIGWVPGEFYQKMDAFNHNGILYTVLIDHTSEATFDPGANDGAGHDYYYPLLEPPGNSLPTGGAAGQQLVKSTGENYAVTWAWNYPAGGSAGKYLRASSSTPDAAAWAAIDAGEVDFTPATDSTISSDNVADALEELAAAIDGGGASLQTMWWPAGAMTPLLTNGPSQGLIETTTNKTLIKTLNFDASTREYAQFDVAMPKSWDLDAVHFRVFWSHAGTTTNFGVAWSLRVVSLLVGDPFEVAITVESVMVDTGGTTDRLYVSDISDPLAILDSTAGTAEFPSMTLFQISRKPADAGDNMAIDARLHGVQIYYGASTGTDDEG